MSRSRRDLFTSWFRTVQSAAEAAKSPAGVSEEELLRPPGALLPDERFLAACTGCNDCVEVCPVDCIYEGEDQYYIHPEECIDCGLCIDACPVNALKTEGIERRTCWNRLNENRDTLEYLSDLPESTHVCGKCAALMPCSFLNPVAKL